MATDDKRTADEIREQVGTVFATLQALEYRREVEVSDYPIGGTDRGRCKMGFEFDPRKGCRSVRTTTNRHRIWCKPKKSVYRDAYMLPARDPGGELAAVGPVVGNTFAGLVVVGRGGIFVQRMNYDPVLSVPAFGHGIPRHRLPRPYTVNGEPHELPADSPEECDAWEAWVESMRPVMKWARGVKDTLLAPVPAEV